MIINEECNRTINAYLAQHMVYCPGCNKRFHSGNHPKNVADITISQTGHLFLLDNKCSSAFFSGNDSRRETLIRRIESRIRKQPEIFCPQELMTMLQSCTKNESDGKIPETRVELGDPPWKESDRAWFIDNPGRAHRLRRRYPEEEGSPDDWIIIRCLLPGARQRVPIQTIRADRVVLLSDNEDALHQFFDLAHDLYLGKVTDEVTHQHVKTLLDGLRPEGNNTKAKQH